MNIEEVKQDSQLKLFLNLPKTLYQNSPQWIEPLHTDVLKALSKDKSYYDKGDIKLWIVMKDDKCVGRIAAFYHSQLRFGQRSEKQNGGMGFFESIPCKNTAKLLLSTAEFWLKEKGVQKIYGPINPFEKDAFWGLLTEGFDLTPGYRKNYHLPYYQELFESNGYEVDYKQFTFKRTLDEGTPTELKNKISTIICNTDYSFKSIRGMSSKIYLNAVLEIYNESWGKIPGYKPMTLSQVQKMFSRMKSIMNPDYIWLAEYQGVPKAFVILLPEIGEFTKDLNGKFGLLQKIKLYLRIKRNAPEKIMGVAFGVHPEHQSSGLAQALLSVSGEWIRAQSFKKNNQVKEMELNWIGDFNKKMIALVESFGATPSKTYVTYKKALV